MVKLDLNIKRIKDSQKIWVVHAGERKKFFRTFYENKAVFLDHPGLNISLESIEDTKKIRQHLRMSYWLRDYHRDPESKRPPSRNPSTYSDESDCEGDRSDFRKRIKSDVGYVNSLFQKAKPGDLVIVTDQGAYGSVLFGEIASPFNPEQTLQLEKYHEPFQYRSVKWLSGRPQRRDLPYNLAKKLEYYNAVYMLPRTTENDGIFQYAYQAYELGETSKTELYGPKYNNSPLGTYPTLKLVSYLMAAHEAVNQNKLEEFCALNISDAIDKFFSNSDIEEFGQEFHSPGKFTLITSAVTLSAFVSCGAALAVNENNLKQPVTITNSQDATDEDKETTEKTEDALNALLESLGDSDRIKQFYELGQESKDSIGLKSSVKIK